MRKAKIPRILFAAPCSGSGKTTVTCAVLRAFVNRGLSVASFKCGPDYIDPMFHRKSVGTTISSNLDLFFAKEETVRFLLQNNAGKADLSVLEGVMGYYDGIAGKSLKASTYAVAKATKTPVVLVVNCRGMSVSIAAQIKGFQQFRKDSQIAAVILNRLPPMLYQEIKSIVEKECGIPVAGYIPTLEDGKLDSRHLGLVTADEMEDVQQKLDILAHQAEKTIDLDFLLKLADSANHLEFDIPRANNQQYPVRIAIAKDSAFCFYYSDTLQLLEKSGAELVEFSPLTGKKLPPDIGGLYLGGGYPELHAKRLSENETMRLSIKHAIENGMPAIAECGGFLYLHRTLQDENKTPYPMAGVIGADAVKTTKLSRFGYVTLTAKQDNLLCKTGECIPAHEFHYWDSTDCGESFCAQKPMRATNWDCVHASKNLWAGFPHLYLPAKPEAASRFVKAAADYQKEQKSSCT